MAREPSGAAASFSAAVVAAAASVIAVSVVAAEPWAGGLPLPQMAAVVALGLLVRALPLEVGHGTRRLVLAQSGTVIVAATLLLPAPLALLAFALVTVVATPLRSPAGARLVAASGTIVAVGLGLGAAVLLAAVLGGLAGQVLGALVGALVALVAHHSARLGHLALHGVAVPRGQRFAMLLPRPLLYLASLAVGVALGLLGRLGDVALLAATLVAAALYVLLWESRRMVGSERRTRLLFDATVALQDATSRQEVEAITARTAAALLGCRHAAVEDAPSPTGLQAVLHGGGRARWIVVRPDLAEAERVREARDVPLLEALAGVAATALDNVALRAELRRAARHDPLTGVLNRGAGDEALREAVARGRRDGVGFAVCFVDLDDFKRVNDRYGHLSGDEVLRTVAARLREQVREVDHVARLGGDEFLVVLHAAETEAQARAAAGKLATALASPVETREGAILVDVSIGSAVWPTHGDDLDALLRHADRAMYADKAEPRHADAAGLEEAS